MKAMATILVLIAVTAIVAVSIYNIWSLEQTDQVEAPLEIASIPGSEYEGEAFTFHRIRDDIYHAVGTGNLSVGSNSAVIINEDDVLLVDSHVSPAAAAVLLEELRAITPKPVRYVVNTHFHFDHAHGNQIYPGSVEIIGHEFTHEMIVTGRSKSGRAYHTYIGSLPERIETVRNQLREATDAEETLTLQKQLSVLENYKAATDAVAPTPPTITLNHRMTIHRGGREIRLMFSGRGHTGGDVVVYLPAERMLITGDLLTGGLPYMGDGYLNEWADTLEQLKELEFDVILPGHGQAFEEREKIDHLTLFLRDLWAKTVQMYRAGVSAEKAARRIDMRNHAENYPRITNIGANHHAVQRVYELLEGRQ